MLPGGAGGGDSGGVHGRLPPRRAPHLLGRGGGLDPLVHRTPSQVRAGCRRPLPSPTLRPPLGRETAVHSGARSGQRPPHDHRVDQRKGRQVMITFVLWFILALHLVSILINIGQIGKPRPVLTAKTVAMTTVINMILIALIAVALFKGGA